MTTTTRTETRKKNGHIFTTTYTIVREPATLSEQRMLRNRWFDYVADHVTECFKVTITAVSGCYGSSGHTSEYFEIVTPSGRGAVSYNELDCWIPNNGPALLYGCFKKYNMYRGNVLAYACAMGVNPDSRTKALHVCPAHIYAIAAGKPWGNN